MTPRKQPTQTSLGVPTRKRRRIAENLYRDESTRVYFAYLKKEGKTLRKSLKTTDQHLARRRLKDLRRQVEGLRVQGRDRKITFATFSERYTRLRSAGLKPSAEDRIRRTLKMLLPTFGDKLVAEITIQDCQDWQVKRGKSIKASTFNKEVELLRGIFKQAQLEGLVLQNPAEHVPRRKVQQKRILIPSRDQFRRVVQVMREGLDVRYHQAADLVELLAYSGMRLGEATAITWGEVDFDREEFVVTGGEVGTKNQEVRLVPLFPSLRTFLERIKPVNPELEQRIIPIHSTKNALATACRVVGTPRFTHHSMRHFFCSNAIENGIDFKTIAAWLGHKDGGLLVSRTYGHLRDSHAREMAKRMDF
ncbi:MAG: tyrosine-type recombinase/integrase [Opitutales bacterium]